MGNVITHFNGITAFDLMTSIDNALDTTVSCGFTHVSGIEIFKLLSTINGTFGTTVGSRITHFAVI
jgi:hypothetical protein